MAPTSLNNTSIHRANSVDLFKAFFAVCIVAIHSGVYKLFGETTQWVLNVMVLRVGVPYFFIASAYFYSKRILNNENIKEWKKDCYLSFLRRNMPPFTVFSFLALVGTTGLSYYREGVTGAIKTMHDAFFYPLGAMWFVSSLLVAAAIYTILWRKWLILIPLAILGYGFALICNTYFFLVQGTFLEQTIRLYMGYFVSARNGIFLGLMLFGIGCFLAIYEDKWTFVSKVNIIIVLVCFIVLQLFECFFTHGKAHIDDSSLFVSVPLTACVLFIFSCRTKMPYSTEYSKKLRRFSTYLYFLHPQINLYLGTAIILFVHSTLINFVIIVLFVFLIWKLTEDSENKWVRKILP